MAAPRSDSAPLERVEVESFVVPTDRLESDGTFEWDRTTVVVVHAHAGGRAGMGHTYAHRAAAEVIRGSLAGVVIGRDAIDVPACWEAMAHAVRNVGHQGIAATAMSALDAALWDLKGKLLGQPVIALLGAARDAVPIYGSGGFTSYDDATLCAQLSGWVEQGITRVKMKVGRDAPRDPERVAIARRAIGEDAELYVDANGAWDRKVALAMAERFAEHDVRWLEEPVSSDDLEGLRLLRDRAPARIEIAAGEYGWDAAYFRRMLEAGAVDVLMPDASRCGGITGFLRAVVLADAHGVPVSSHCAPALHVHAACASSRVRHVEWFHDHARIEAMLFEGAPRPQDGCLRPDRSRPGLGLELKRRDATRFAPEGAHA